MSSLEQVLLTFLLNASWQVSLIVTFAVVCDWLLRGVAARYRHWLWVATLVACLALPAVTCVRFATANTAPQTAAGGARATVTSRILTPGVEIATNSLTQENAGVRQALSASPIRVNAKLALLLSVFYGLLVGWRLVGLLRAWHRTRRTVRSAFACDFSASFQEILEDCRTVIRPGPCRVLCSADVPVPITTGVFKRLIILPQRFESEADIDVLRSAIGHELVHVARRDYLTNLVYEFIYVPLSFHPAAAFARRRIKHTRELCCDETVAARLIKPDVYARSLVRLIGSAPIWRPLSPDTTIGINESDILEVRIMSLLKTTRLSPRRRTLLLIAAALLLVIPCAAAARFALSFDAAKQEPSSSATLPQKREAREREEAERQIVELYKQANALKERMQQAPERERSEIEIKLREVEKNLRETERTLEQYGRTKERTAVATRETAEQEAAMTSMLREAKEKLELEQQANQGDRKARLIYHTEPAYPPDAREKKIEGGVVLGFTVNHQGIPEGIQIKKSLYPSLDKAAAETVSTWRFEPAMKNGQPVSMWMEAEVSFSLNGEEGQRVEAVTRDGRTEALLVRRGSEASRRAEREEEERNQRELARNAKISMDQAIQIATSKTPGKVLECSLVGEHWIAPGELAKPSLVFYRVLILSGDDANPVNVNVLVNAADGSIFKTTKQEGKREEEESPSLVPSEGKAINGGVLNGKAKSLPVPEYPLIARQAGAAGTVAVEILIDEGGNVVAAHSVSGHPLLQAAAVNAARQATFAPTRLNGNPVMVRGVVTYNFVAQ
jgi:TonB family protein